MSKKFFALCILFEIPSQLRAEDLLASFNRTPLRHGSWIDGRTVAVNDRGLELWNTGLSKSTGIPSNRTSFQNDVLANIAMVQQPAKPARLMRHAVPNDEDPDPEEDDDTETSSLGGLLETEDEEDLTQLLDPRSLLNTRQAPVDENGEYIWEGAKVGREGLQEGRRRCRCDHRRRRGVFSSEEGGFSPEDKTASREEVANNEHKYGCAAPCDSANNKYEDCVFTEPYRRRRGWVEQKLNRRRDLCPGTICGSNICR